MRLADAFMLIPEFVPGQYEQFQNHLNPEWVEDALAATGTATIRRRRLPAEQTMLNDLAIFTEPWRKKRPYGDTEGDPHKGWPADPKSYFLYFFDDGTYGQETHADVKGFWLRGEGRAEVLLRALEPVQADVCASYRIGGWTRLTRVVLPAASPQIVTGLRQALSIGIILMVISEMFAANSGLGFTIVQFQRSFAIPEMWTGIILLGVIGFVLSLLFRLVEHRSLAWYRGLRDADRGV